MELTKLAKALGSTIDTAVKISMGTGAVFVGAACHAVAQGALSMMQGGKFLSGAAAGFLGHLGGAAWGEIGGNFAGSDVGAIGFGALSGGVGAELTGGNFWTGAVTGGIVAGLNGVFHKIGDQPGKKAGWDSNDDGKLQKSEADNIYLEGRVDEITVNGNNIDLTGLQKEHMTYNPKTGVYSLATTTAFKVLPYETASTYGGSSFKFVNGKFRMLSQDYHYVYRPNNSIENVARNFATSWGKPSSYRNNRLYGPNTYTPKAYKIVIKY
jgi:hypothetical protein